jgi:hypothetical protein
MRNAAALWWMPGALLGLVGLIALAAGFAAGGPDVAGCVVFGAVALVTAVVLLWRRAPAED